MAHSFLPSFGSDNHSGVHPKILQSLTEVNLSHAPSYGTDDVTKNTNKTFQNLFGQDCHSFFVFNGTAANVLAIKALIPSYKSVICTDVSHLNLDECGAPEAFAGVKLQTVNSYQGKLRVSDLEDLMIRGGDQHFSQPGLISITQPTELGTVYSLAELGEIGEFAQKHNLRVHVDGARLTNSIVALKCQFSDLKDALNPDAISFGGTKNGLLGVEAVLLFDKHAANQFKYIRKQNMQLPSKTRFLASQFSAYFEGDLHLEIAIHSHGMAAKLAKALEPFSQINVLYPVESNAVFATIPKEWTKRLREAMHFYVWDEKQWSIRLMCSFDTTEEHIEHFVATATSLAKGEPL